MASEGVPTLVLHGENDLVVPVAHGRAIASAARAKFEAFDAGHNSIVLHRQQLLRTLEAFFAREATLTPGAAPLSSKFNSPMDARAVELYTKAAEQGDANAQLNLGVMYANGHGVSQDYVRAGEWTRKASNQGNAPAQYNLGLMYMEGYGVTKDDRLAVKLIRKAAKQGYKPAQDLLDSM